MQNRVKELRKQNGLRQEDLARVLSVSRQTIFCIENDKYDPSLDLAFKMAAYFSTTIEDLFTHRS